ncbi:MAG TPA: hypothetical protein VN922_19405 [Bacteroidia bacterium]|nr:hypothetical protein [Bacteroidia bacterium]
MPEFDRLTSYQHNDIKNSLCYQWWCFHVEVENFGAIIEKLIKRFFSVAAKILK